MDKDTKDRFDAVDKRFDSIEARMATKDDISEVNGHIADVYVAMNKNNEDMNRQFGVMMEHFDHRFQLLLEAIGVNKESLERHKAVNEKEHDALDRSCLENKAATDNLSGRVARLEKAS
ncbi:MAG: hypothetical protein HZA22_06095 [Nitrospirae bacterium]|nr:hypothetical protein [Nitrospirota bacterium]